MLFSTPGELSSACWGRTLINKRIFPTLRNLAIYFGTLRSAELNDGAEGKPHNRLLAGAYQPRGLHTVLSEQNIH